MDESEEMDETEEFLDYFGEVEVDLHCSGEDYQKYKIQQPTKKVRKIYKQIRPKVNSEWCHEDILKLINAVEERPTIWDVSSPQYKLPKLSAWQEIADCIGERTADECKAKWSNLRVTFKTNLSKSKRQKSGSAAGGSIVWKYFKAMLFLDVNETSETTESICSMNLPSDDTNLECVLPIQQKRDRKISSVPPSSDAFKEMAAKAICTIAEKSKNSEKQIENKFDVFGEHVATELKSLALPKALFAKRKLARALVDIMDEFQSENQT